MALLQMYLDGRPRCDHCCIQIERFVVFDKVEIIQFCTDSSASEMAIHIMVRILVGRGRLLSVNVVIPGAGKTSSIGTAPIGEKTPPLPDVARDASAAGSIDVHPSATLYMTRRPLVADTMLPARSGSMLASTATDTDD